MPWCGPCERFLSPSTVKADGTCPECGGAVEPGAAQPAPAAADEETSVPLPWHFKLLLAALAVYLGWRAIDGIAWVARQL